MDNLPKIARDFRRLYKRAAADGRGEALFGKDTCELATKMLCGGAINTSGQVGFFFEFPLTGEPRMDLLLRYEVSDLPSPVKFFDGGDGFGCQTFFDECACDETLRKYICGYSFDISDGRDVPGVYLLPWDAPFSGDYLPNMLKRLGCAERTEAVEAAFAAAPPAWQPYYIGCMRGRPGAPTRIGFYVKKETRERYAENASLAGAKAAHPCASLADEIERYYKTPFAPSDRAKMDAIIKTGNLWEIQFDLYPLQEKGGAYAFGDGLGLGVSFGDIEFGARRMTDVTERGKTGELMRQLESWGIADERWRIVDKACYGFSCVVPENGRHRHVADIVQLHSMKVRFRGGRPSASKIYLLAGSCDLKEFKGGLHHGKQV